MAPPPLRVHLLLPSADSRAVLVEEGDGQVRLPAYEPTFSANDTAVMVVRRLLDDSLRVSSPVLETHLRPGPADGEPVTVLHTLAVCEPSPAGWQPPTGLRWQSLEEPAPAAPEPVRERLGTWLEEWRTGAPPPPLRSRWSQPGWYARATEWIATVLAAAGRELDGPVEVRRLWGISALMHARTNDGGSVWFKAVFAPFKHEPAVSTLLERVAPELVAHVIGADTTEWWLLLDHVPGAEAGDASAAALTDAIDRLVRLQRSLIAREAELIAMGCRERRLGTLVDDLLRATSGSPPLPGLELPPARVTELLEWVREKVGWLSGFGLPDVAIHGDFHTNNLLLTDRGPVVIDWSDTAIAHPLMEVAAFFDDVDDPEVQAACWEAWLDALAPLGDVEGLRSERETVYALASAYQVVTYADIVRNLEPAKQYQFSDGVAEFLGHLDTVVPR